MDARTHQAIAHVRLPFSAAGGPFLRVATIAAAALFLIAWWQRDALPPPARLDAALQAEPVQLPTDRPPFQTTVGGIQYSIRPLYTYDLYGLVVSKHDTDAWWDVVHEAWNDRINVADLCVIWGANAVSGSYRGLEFSNLSTSCWLHSAGDPPGFDVTAWSNNHLLSDDPAISRALKRVRVGDQVHFRGYLAEYSHDTGFKFRRGTSISRMDKGDGACETVYATDIEIIHRGNAGWRFTFWLALVSLVAAVATRTALALRGDRPMRPHDVAGPRASDLALRAGSPPSHTRVAPLSLDERAQMFAQLASLEGAGVPVAQAFASLPMARSGERQVVAMRRYLLRQGIASAGERSGLFTAIEARLVGAACAVGSPQRVYQRLSDVYVARARVVAKLKAQMLLPAFILLFALMVRPLPALAAGVIGAGGYLLSLAKSLIVIWLVAYGLSRWLTLARVRGTPLPWPGLRWVPLVGAFVVRQNVRDFLESLGLMLEGGIPMFEALPLALQTVTEPSLRDDLERVAQNVTAGSPLARALAGSSFPDYATEADRAISFINTGEGSGTLPDMLLRHAAMETVAIEERYALVAKMLPEICYWGAMACAGAAVLGAFL